MKTYKRKQMTQNELDHTLIFSVGDMQDEPLNITVVTRNVMSGGMTNVGFNVVSPHKSAHA